MRRTEKLRNAEWLSVSGLIGSFFHYLDALRREIQFTVIREFCDDPILGELAAALALLLDESHDSDCTKLAGRSLAETATCGNVVASGEVNRVASKWHGRAEHCWDVTLAAGIRYDGADEDDANEEAKNECPKLTHVAVLVSVLIALVTGDVRKRLTTQAQRLRSAAR